MNQEYWKWPESKWTSKDIDWKKANTVTVGVDVGAVSTQAVVMCDDEVYSYANIRTGTDVSESAKGAMEQALDGNGMKMGDIHKIVSTGYGRKKVPFAQKAINEITCHAKGARYMYGPSVRSVLDMGGQTSNAIKCYEWGQIADFQVNDKCAISMGRSIEMMADLLHVPIQDMGEKSLSVTEEPEPVCTTCYIYCNTEAIGLLREGYEETDMLASYLFAIAYRLYTLIGRLKPEAGLALTGGVAKNAGVVKRLERELGLTALPSKYDTQLAGAIGAALFAKVLSE